MKTHSTTTAFKYVIALITTVACFQSSAQQDYYWVGGTGDWSHYTSHWATSSGGTEFHTSVPTQADNVYFDENSFTAEGQIVSIVGPSYCHDLDWTEVTFSPRLTDRDPGNTFLQIAGSMYLHASMYFEQTRIIFKPGFGESEVLKTNEIALNRGEITFNLANGGFALLDSLSAQGVRIFNGNNAFSTNGNPIHLTGKFSIPTAFQGSLDLVSTNIYSRDVEIDGLPQLDGSLNMSEASISIIYPDGTTEIDKDIYTYPIVENYKIEADHTIGGSSPIFDNLEIIPGVELKIDDAIEGVEFNQLIANGTITNQITIKSDNEGTAATLIQSTGESNIYGAILQDIEGTGGAIFNAFASIDNGNVSGFSFMKADQELIFELEDKDYEDVNSLYVPVIANSSGLDVSLSSNNESVVSVINGTELFIKGIGTAIITASHSGDVFHNPVTVSLVMNVTKADQTITLADILDIWIGDERVTLSGSSSSDLAVTYQINGPATLDGNVLEFTGSGTVQVTASQAGDDNYNAAEDEIVTFEVYKKAQTITFAEIADISEDAGFVNLDATSDSGLPVTYSVVGPGEVVDGAMEFIGNGMVQVTAMQAGDDLYLEAEQVRRSFEIIASDTEKPLFLTQPEGLGSIYPNPVADYLHFDPQLNIETIHITDLAGKVYYEGVVEGERLDMSSWEVGTYILTINTTNGEEHVARILKH